MEKSIINKAIQIILFLKTIWKNNLLMQGWQGFDDNCHFHNIQTFLGYQINIIV